MSGALLEMRDVTKVYPNGVMANYKVRFSLREGEIHAIVGENGAGKSTLMKMMFGMEEPSEGEILLRGEKVKLASPQDAIDRGIGMVHQHFMLVPSFTVAENMVLGMEPKKGLGIHFAEAVRMTEEMSRKYNLAVDPKAKVENLTVGMKQKVEILKALLRGAKILILDEPTAVLTPQETEELFRELRLLKDQGHTIVFISHKLKEVKAICDRITIMRAGRSEDAFRTADVTEQEISRLMVGRDVVLKYDKEKREAGETILAVRGFSLAGSAGSRLLSDVGFTVRAGEIVGIAGVEGNGQTPLVEALTGSLAGTAVGGSVTVKGADILRADIRAIRKHGVSYIPEDRMRQGAAGEASIADNLISTQYASGKLGGGMFMNGGKIERLAASLIEAFDVRCSGPKQPIGMLSGGNMQKVVVARECSTEPDLLIAEQPTRGVDIGAAQFIHRKLIELRDRGCAILLVSADLNEILELSDKLLVLYEGRVTAYFEEPSAVGEEELGLYMLGINRQDPEQIGRAVHR
ncbi:ABC transporter ATP-binding protein [Cohnella thailandensis]|uniref:ABC transporter ATP-binding protein n=1 Tax=Cohnella thailandensis TaxID=557557 RepID=A0A841SZK0_9BACL|nr:ABC transporter ATP-binding protein [Cohnella thailandensis]MBB6636056.1 ABC transporter ATP-binding protein [Cohnella thailandensis]MBP1976789.1 simple sugar transport system ATP-binding protein [Cohnella thailandensis]